MNYTDYLPDKSTFDSLSKSIYNAFSGFTNPNVEPESNSDQHTVVKPEKSDDPDVQICQNYISRKDRVRRGKREKKGRVMMNGVYHEYDEDSLQYFRAYKSTTRGIQNATKKTVDIGTSGVTTLYSGAANATTTVLGLTHPPISSEQIPDVSNGSISFSGGGYNCAYHLGIVQYIFEHTDMFDSTIYLGASGGAGVAAIALAYQSDPNRMEVLDSIIQTLVDMGDELNNLSEQVERYTQLLLDFIDQDRFDKYIKENDRLRISLTEVTNYLPTNRIVTNFETLEQLEDTIRASACIPGLLDNQVRKIDEKSYLDGGLTNNLPIVDQTTIRISCLNYPTLRAEVHPHQYLSIVTCFTHPGERKIRQMLKDGYESFDKYMQGYIEKVEDERISAEIDSIENEFIES